MRKRINADAVKALQPGETLWDTEVRGLGIRRRRAGGWARYVLRFDRAGRTRWVTIGAHGSPWTPETARDEARRLLVELAAGRDPAEAREAALGIPTVAQFVKRYLKEHVEPHRAATTAQAYRDLVRRHVVPAFGRQRLDDVARADVVRFHLELGREHPITANRCLALLSHLYTQAARWGVVTGNPARGVERFVENRRARFLSMAELARVGEALRRLEEDGLPKPGGNDEYVRPSPRTASALRLLILTGARLSEILTLRWSAVDLARRALILPPGTRGTKRRTAPKTVRLNAAAVAVLEEQPRVDGNPYVFPARGHWGRDGRHITNLEDAWQRVRAVAGVRDVRIHDLRHSFASVAAGAGVSLPVIGAMLGHTEASTTQRYAHLANDPLADVAENVGRLVGAALSGRKTE